ncbi:hypothetical protein L2E82_11383 [Cichorium intybus]|uniref:Uncharacterized protein n=1 Tax=Cichorium intybus TaxID=13427 RepID=A0ACB9GE94_CICIN|nr:hypothetical protein L2E82_11383 [Cichorium intybus]
MLFTIVSLLLFLLFVVLIHLYARWYLVQARPRTPTASITIPHISRHRLHRRSTTRLGLPSSVIASLPLFIHRLSPTVDSSYVLECIICLSVFQDEEIGKKLPGCGHAFHVECIDMWLYSHSTCPICRAPILYNYKLTTDNVNHIVDHVEIDIVDPEHVEIDDEIRYPIEESPKSTTASLEIHSGPSCSHS